MYRYLRSWLFSVLILLGILLTTVPVVYSQSTTSPPVSSPSPLLPDKAKGTPVILGDETLFNIQARIGSFSPEFRAQVVTDRIETLADSPEISLDALQTVDNEATKTVDIKIRDRTLMTIADVDAVAAGKTRQELADKYLLIIKKSVTEFRAAHSSDRILRGVIYTLIATLILILGLVVSSKLSPVIYQRLQQRRGNQIQALTVLGSEILSADRVVELIWEIVKVFRLALLLGLFYFYINLCLSFFPWTQGLSRTLFGYVLTAFQTLGVGIIAYLPKLFVLAFIWLITSYVLKIFRFLFTEIEQGNITFNGFYPEWANSTSKL
jgi:hypothetical protein